MKPERYLLDGKVLQHVEVAVSCHFRLHDHVYAVLNKNEFWCVPFILIHLLWILTTQNATVMPVDLPTHVKV